MILLGREMADDRTDTVASSDITRIFARAPTAIYQWSMTRVMMTRAIIFDVKTDKFWPENQNFDNFLSLIW